MILLVDIGNTRIKWGLLRNGVLGSQDHAVWYGTSFEEVFQTSWKTIAKPERVVVANVVQTLALPLSEWSRENWSVVPEFVAVSAKAFGIVNGYHNPKQLGVDRWMAVVGAWHAVRDAVCVVDCGTAVTIDAVTAEGEYRGGLIAPGMGLMRTALTGRSSALTEDGDSAEGVLARSTEQAVAAGALNAVVGLIDRTVSELSEALGGSFHCLITGGDAVPTLPHLSDPLRHPWQHHPDLVLQGLAIAAEDAP